MHETGSLANQCAGCRCAAQPASPCSKAHRLLYHGSMHPSKEATERSNDAEIASKQEAGACFEGQEKPHLVAKCISYLSAEPISVHT
eukprot:6187768-Pleurochrysis_carterae.AAC.1